MQLERAAGVLLHLTSLPSRYGIGDMGESAFEFIDFLSAGGQTLWQILPLNPVGYGESPYQAYSAFAGNHLLIDPASLRQDGFLSDADVKEVPEFPLQRVDFAAVIPYKQNLLRKAFRRFQENPPFEAYHRFTESNSHWLKDYALFMALKEHFHGLPWYQWDKSLAWRKEDKLEYYRWELRDIVDFHCFLQFAFFRQWRDLHRYAADRGVRIVGDLPIFVAADSSDAWVNPHLFELAAEGLPAKVAGVPPDYFSPTGQRWGNPLYRWAALQQDEYSWWRERVRQILELVDVIRIDHFRGFEAYWEIPGAEETAVKGRWVKGPGERFFAVLEKYLGKLPIIAEDLGYITPEVQALKDTFEFPGMKVLQFVTEEKLVERPQLENIVYYTGTHDNDTLLGWYQEKILGCLDRSSDNGDICWVFIETLYRSNAAWVITPIQDILGLGSEARMNTPGTLGGNWRWRLEPNVLNKKLAAKLSGLTREYKRQPCAAPVNWIE